MRRVKIHFPIAPAYRGRTLGAIERLGFTLGPSMREEPSAQFGAIGAIDKKCGFWGKMGVDPVSSPFWGSGGGVLLRQGPGAIGAFGARGEILSSLAGTTQIAPPRFRDSRKTGRAKP
jgi:hypothetical protein